MKLWTGVCCVLLAIAAPARPDTVRLVNGRVSQGAVVSWGTEEIRFVLQGGTLADAVTVPVRMVEVVVLSDGTEHRPGTGSWLAAGRLDSLPWAQPRPLAPQASPPLGRGVQRMTIGLRAERQSGTTTYRISFPWGPYYGNSRLDFPLDGYATVLTASLRSKPSTGQSSQYGLDVEFAVRLSDPKREMTDSDYVCVSAWSIDARDRLVFSATTSAARAGEWGLTVAGRALTPLGTQVKLGGLLGFRYQRISYDIYGVKGWQDTTFAGDIVYFDELRDTRVLQYRVSYGLPMVGVLLLAESSNNLSLQARAAYLPFVSGRDEDLHLLRNKKSVIQASGRGWLLGCDAWVRLATMAGGASLSLAGDAEYFRVDADGSQTQTYYGDDPGIADDQTGLTNIGIDAKMAQRRFRVGLALTYGFK